VLDQCHGAPVALNERHLRGPAAECLDSYRAGPGKRIEHQSPREARRQNVEERLAQLVGRRAKTVPGGRLEPPSFIPAGNHSHDRTRQTRRDRRDATGTTILIMSCVPVTRPPAVAEVYLPHLNQPELLLPLFLHKRGQVRSEPTGFDQLSRFAMRVLHDVAIADEVTRPQPGQA